MAMPTFKCFGNNLITKKWEGRESNPTVIGLEMIASNEDEYFKEWLDYLEKWKESILNKKLEDIEDSDYARKYYYNLKKDLDGATPKITIKIELEKYE